MVSTMKRAAITLFLVLSGIAVAQDGGLPGAILNYGMSPRTLALGKSFTGLADDQEACYFNPAGLAQLFAHNVKASYFQLHGSRLEYLGYALPTRRFGTIGVSIINLGSDDVDSRNEDMAIYPEFNASENCFIFSYAYQPARFFSLGANLKAVSGKIAQYGAVGLGGDIGVFLFPRQPITLGATVKNLGGPRLTYWEQTDEYPVTLSFGGAIRLYGGRAVVAVDLAKTMLEYTSPEPRLGIEFTPLYPIVTLRVGLDQQTVSGGIGLSRVMDNMSLGIDYSVELHHGSSYLLQPRHKIGLRADFGGFRTWIKASPKQFSPRPGRKENVAWLDVHYTTKRDVARWQILIKNQFGEVVRTYSGWEAPPLRLSWDGLDDVGRLVSDGRYYYEIVVVDTAGEAITFSDYLTSVVTLGPEGEIEFVPQE